MIRQQTFLQNGEWSTVFHPEQPSGFSVMLIGGENHFIQEDSSVWSDHPGKRRLVERLTDKGYTLLGSHLGGKHWGSEQAASYAAELYAFFIRQEIVNEKIHIFAEGMGALIVGQLCEKLAGRVRSVVLLNPVLSLADRYKHEKKNKLFSKKVSKEMCKAHKVEEASFQEWLNQQEDVHIPQDIPVLVIHVLDQLKDDITSIYQGLKKELNMIEVKYITTEKRYVIPYQMVSFFQKHEKIL